MMKTHTRSLLVTVILSCGAGAVAYAGGEVDTTFIAANFSASSANITNPYWPLPAGTTFVYRSVGKDSCQVNTVQVTDVTPVIYGVKTREVHDQVYEDDDCDGVVGDEDLSEDTYDWYAQDMDGLIWYLGENSLDIASGSTEGSWIAGEDVANIGSIAEPGIIILAHPSVSTNESVFAAPGLFYRQEYYEDEAEDMAKVLRLNADVTLTFPHDNNVSDEYSDCLVTKEWSPLERGAIEQKFYCAGTGLVLNNEFHGGTVRTELVAIEHDQ
jgi:hypothetical protein